MRLVLSTRVALAVLFVVGSTICGNRAGGQTAGSPAMAPLARDPHTAQPERPTVATHAGTVSTGWLEFESGIEIDRGPGSTRNTMGTTLAKLGIADNMQLGLLATASKPEGFSGGLGDATISLKWRITDANAWLGDFAVEPGLKLPTGSVASGTGTGTTDASLLLISSRDVGPLHIDVNAGYTARSGDGTQASKSQWLWTASFGGVLGGTTGWTAELYGYPGTGGAAGAPPLVGLLFGPTFTVRSWLVFDVGTIVPVAGGQAHAIYAGATYNVGRMFQLTDPRRH